MLKNRIPITLKLPPEMLERLEVVRGKIPGTPTKTGCIEEALEVWLARQETALRIKPGRAGK
jgi:hypothetical protein